MFFPLENQYYKFTANKSLRHLGKKFSFNIVNAINTHNIRTVWVKYTSNLTVQLYKNCCSSSMHD